jgi:hypothetical protein
MPNCASRSRGNKAGTDGGPSVPIQRAADPNFTPISSIVNIPFEIKTSYIEKTVNRQLGGILYETDTLTLGSFKNVSMSVRKGGNIKIQLRGNELIYRVPLKISMRFAFTIGALGLNHTEYKDVEAGIILNLRSKIFLNKNWSLTTTTKLEDYSWTSDPVVKMRFISIPVKPAADFFLSKQAEALGGIIDQTVSSGVNVKELVNPLWLKLQEPLGITVAEIQQQIWLKLTPDEVYMTPVSGRGGKLTTSIGVRAAAETFIGEKPQSTAPVKLPNFSTPGKIDSAFVVNLYSEISYEQATLLSQQILTGKTFSSGKQEVIVQDIAISGMDGFAIVRLDLIGSFKGRLYLIGRAVYDEKTQTILLEDIDYDMTTQSRFHKTANWLLRGIIISKMKPLMRFPLKDKLAEAQVLAQQMLENKEVYSNVYLNGKIDSISIGGIELTDSSFRTVVLARGALTITNHKL